MKKQLLVLSLLISTVSFSQTTPTIAAYEKYIDRQQEIEPAIGTAFGSFKAKFDNDSILNNRSLKGKVVFIHFWDEAYPPGMAEMEALNELYEKMKGTPYFEFLSFTIETRRAIKKIKKQYNIKYPIASISNNLCEQLMWGHVFPTTVILDKNGRVRYMESSCPVDKEMARAAIMEIVYVRLIMAFQ